MGFFTNKYDNNHLISTHLCLMEFPALINWMNQFQVQEMLGSTFQFQSSFKCAFCEQTVQNQIRHGSAMSDLVLHCFPVSHKKDTGLKA